MKKISLFCLLIFSGLALYGAGIKAVNPSMQGKVVAQTGLPANWQVKHYTGRETAGDVYTRQTSAGRVLEIVWASGAVGFGVEPELTGTIEPDTAYKVQAWFATGKNGAGRIAMEFFDDKGNTLGESLSPIVRSASGKVLTHTFTPKAGAKTFRIYLLNITRSTVKVKDFALTSVKGKTTVQTVPFTAVVTHANDNVYRFGKPTVQLVKDFPMPFPLDLAGDKKKLNNPTLVIDMPAAVEIKNAYSNHPGAYRDEKLIITDITRNNQPYRRYRIEKARTFDILLPVSRAERRVTLVLLPKPNAAINSEYTMYFHEENAGVAAKEKSVAIRVLPPLADNRRPKNFRVARWRSNDFFYPERTTLNAAMAAMEKCSAQIGNNVPGVCPASDMINDLYIKRNWQIMYASAACPGIKQYWNKKAFAVMGGNVPMALHTNGKEMQYFCPEFIASDPRVPAAMEFFEMAYVKDMLKLLERIPGNRLIFSLDSEPWYTMDWCFCTRCREKFARTYKLKKVPTAVEIRKNHVREWVEFRCKHTAKLVKLEADTFRKFFPGAQVWDYNYFVDPADPMARLRRVAKDYRLLDESLDMHLPSYYHIVHKASFTAMNISSKQLKKNTMPFCALQGPCDWLSREMVLSPQQIRQFVLAAAINGCPGISIYPGFRIDGDYWHALNQATGEVAQIEDFVAREIPDADGVVITPRAYRERRFRRAGKPVVISYPDWKTTFACRSKQVAADKVLCGVFNYHLTDVMFADIKVKLPAGKYTAYNALNGRILAAGVSSANLQQKGLLVKVEPNDVAIVMFRKVQAGDRVQSTSQNELEKNFEAIRRNYGREAAFIPVAEQGWRIAAVDESNTQLVMQKGQTQVICDLKTGTVNSFKHGRKSLNLKLGSEVIWLPTLHSGTKFKYAMPQGRVISKDKAEIVFKSELKVTGMQWEKRIKLNSNGTLEIAFKYRNAGEVMGFKVQQFANPNLPLTMLLADGSLLKIPFETVTGFFSGNKKLKVDGQHFDKTPGRSIEFAPGRNSYKMSFSAAPEAIYRWRATDGKNATTEYIFTQNDFSCIYTIK